VATLVFGVGYIGSRLVQELLYQGREVVAFDNLFASDHRAIDGFSQAPGFRFIEGSIVDAGLADRAIDLARDLDAVYILAAQASAHPEAAPPEYTEDVNLRGPRLILDAVVRRHLDVPMVYASSTRVYGSPLPTVVDESTPYGVFGDLCHLSKCYAEKLLEMYAARHRLRCRAVRLGLVYGVAPVMKTDPRFMTAPNLFCYQAATGQSLEVRNRDALAVIHVEDAARALLWSAEQIDAPGYSVFNAASAVTTVSEVAETIRQIGESKELSVSIRSMVRGANGLISIPVIRSALTRSGFSPQRNLEEGLTETLDHFLVHGQ
jgi:UDP-glucose 4-epimerase